MHLINNQNKGGTWRETIKKIGDDSKDKSNARSLGD